MSSSPKQPYQSQIDALSERLDYQDERFDQLEAKRDQIPRAFENLPSYDQPQTPPKIPLEMLVDGVVWNMARGPNGPYVWHPKDDKGTGNYRESRYVDLATDRRTAHEGYSSIIQKVNVDVPYFDSKIDVTTFSN